MHPILAQSRRLGLYLFVFLQAGLLLGELLVRTAGAPRNQAMVVAVPLMLVHAFTCLASWYLCRSQPLGTARPERLLIVHLAAAALAGGLATALGGGWSLLLERSGTFEGTTLFYRDGATLVFVFALLVFGLAVAVHYLFLATEASRAAEGRAFELRLLAREAEIKALKAQIDPHFLFNSLNSISGLVAARPDQARHMCAALAGFLRQSLAVGDLEHHAIADELALAERYLAVEQVRFGDRLGIELAVDEGCADCEVPPLILQPLVENAVRHGIAQLLEGGRVRLGAGIDRGRLCLTVENPRDPDRAAARAAGIGLDNVRRRLATEFGEEATLSVDAGPDRFRVEVRLPVRRAAAPAVAGSRTATAGEPRARDSGASAPVWAGEAPGGARPA